MMSIYVSLGERQSLLIFLSMVKKRNIGKKFISIRNPETLVADVNILHPILRSQVNSLT